MGFEDLISNNTIITPSGEIKLLDPSDVREEDMWKCPDCGELYLMWFKTATIIDQSRCAKCRAKGGLNGK